MTTVDDLPEPNEEPTEIDPELERLLTWFIKNRRRVAWSKGAEEIWIAPHDTYSKVKSKELRFKVWAT